MYVGFSDRCFFSSSYLIYIHLGQIKDINQIRAGFTTAVWKKCLQKGKITSQQQHLALSILYHNNRRSIDLLAHSETIRNRWIEGLEYLIQRYRSHLRTHHQITDQWISYLFNRADGNQAGQLSRNEIRRLLFTLNIELDGREIDYYFNQANIRTKNYDELKNLDRDEFYIFYKFVAYRPELVKIICQ